MYKGTESRPRRHRGGVTRELLDRVNALERTVESLSGKLSGKVDTNRITRDTAVTEAGWAVDARQINPAIDGTLASDVGRIRERMDTYGMSGNVGSNWPDFNRDRFTGNGIFYIVKNGICFVSMELEPVGSVSNGDVICSDLPCPAHFMYLSLAGPDASYSARLRTDGVLELYYPLTSEASRIDATFSYPVRLDAGSK